MSRLYFQRKMDENGEFPKLYIYDDIPSKLKNHLINLWTQKIGRDIHYPKTYEESTLFSFYKEIYDELILEIGLLKLTKDEHISQSYSAKVMNFFLPSQSVDYLLTVIESIINQCEKSYSTSKTELLIEYTNRFFLENGVGFQYENGKIIRIDSQYLHSVAVLPVLTLLYQLEYKGAQDEFLSAHEHYRHQRYQEAMVDCQKAYESTIKIIMNKRGWEFSESDTADALTGKLLQKGLVPDYW